MSRRRQRSAAYRQRRLNRSADKYMVQWRTANPAVTAFWAGEVNPVHALAMGLVRMDGEIDADFIARAYPETDIRTATGASLDALCRIPMRPLGMHAAMTVNPFPALEAGLRQWMPERYAKAALGDFSGFEPISEADVHAYVSTVNCITREGAP